MSSLFNGKYSQYGNRFLPIKEAYLEPGPKSSMESPIVNAQLRSKYASASSSRLNVNNAIHKIFLGWKSVIKIVTVLYYHNRFIIQRNKLNNRVTLILVHFNPTSNPDHFLVFANRLQRRRNAPVSLSKRHSWFRSWRIKGEIREVWAFLSFNDNVCNI